MTNTDKTVKPRLTNAAIEAACKAHFGTSNADGVSVTANEIDWSFRDAFRRMWHGAWSALEPASRTQEPAEWQATVGMTLNFFASVIKSGEPWTATCQAEFDKAHEALRAAALSKPGEQG